MINLTKKIEPGTWRHLGLRCPSIAPEKAPIAGDSINAICDSLQGIPYRIGRINPHRAFVVIKETARFLYVNPNYKNYRYAASKVFPGIAWSADFDHALAKNICQKTSPPYQYTLMLRVPPSVNRQHGSLEKKNKLHGTRPTICFADDRILDKWLGRPLQSRQNNPAIRSGYSYNNPTARGLTLKQRGIWAYAIGIDDNNLPMSGLTEIHPSERIPHALQRLPLNIQCCAP